MAWKDKTTGVDIPLFQDRGLFRADKFPPFDTFFQQSKDALQAALKIPEEYVYPKDLQAALLSFAATRYQAAQAGEQFIGSQELYQGAKTNFICDVDHYQKLMAKPYETQPKASEIVTALEAQMQQFLAPVKTNGMVR